MRRRTLRLAAAFVVLLVATATFGRGTSGAAQSDVAPSRRVAATVAAMPPPMSPPNLPALAPGSGTPSMQDAQLVRDREASILSVPRSPKLDSHLAELTAADRNLRQFGLRATPENAKFMSEGLQGDLITKAMRVSDSSMVQVAVVPTADLASAAAVVQQHGGTIELSDAGGNLVQAEVPAGSLDAISLDSAVSFVRPPDYGFVAGGSVTTQGDSILRADIARSMAGLSGAGIRVGVISDGVEGLAASQFTGDLGALNTTACNVGPGTPTSAGAGAEGTAMLEIIHDLAPNAELWFGSWGPAFGGTASTFNAAINCLAANVDVVVDDIGFFNAGPYDGTSFISANTTAAFSNPANRARVHVTAVGNDGQGHYLEPYVPCGTFQQVSATANTIDLVGLGTRCDNPVYVGASSPLSLVLSWNDPYGASCNNYDLMVFVHNSATLIASSTNIQSCSQNPTERISLFNSGSAAVIDVVMVNHAGLAAPRYLNLFAVNGPLVYYLTPSWAISNQADALGNTLSAAAIDARIPPYNVAEPYSSRGPTYDGRPKPEIAAVDCVTVTGDGGFHVPFCGTSAAAPHVAAIAALLLECQPSLRAFELGDNPAADRSTLRSELIASAVDLPPAGYDYASGAGRIDALNAVTSSCLANTATPTTTNTPTRTTTPTPTITPSPTITPTATATQVPCAIRRADVDGDGVVSILDLAAVATYFGQSVPPVPAAYDQDGDHVISILDLATMATYYGQSVAAC